MSDRRKPLSQSILPNTGPRESLERSSNSVSHGEPFDRDRTFPYTPVDSQRRERNLPAFRVFPFIPKDLRQAGPLGRISLFEIRNKVTSPNQGRSGMVTGISSSNSLFLCLTGTNELPPRPARVPVRDAKLAPWNYQARDMERPRHGNSWTVGNGSVSLAMAIFVFIRDLQLRSTE